MSQNTDRRGQTGSLQHQAEHTRSRRRAPIAGYMAILFATAFLLLGLAYFQQQRLNTEATDALKQSASAVETIQNMMEENETLRARVEELEARQAELEQKLWNSEAFSAEVQNDLREKNDAVKAMDYFWQIDEAYALKRYTTCRELIRSFEESGLVPSLPSEKAFDNKRFCPQERYQEICGALD